MKTKAQNTDSQDKNSHSTEYLLRQAHECIALARSRAEHEPPTTENLAEIHRLCATSEFNLRRALKNTDEDEEYREAANSLLIPKAINQPLEREQTR
jgi:hypothetical protein